MIRVSEVRQRIANEIRRWFQEESPGAAYAAGKLPPSLRAARDLTRSHRLSSLLPYERFDPETQLFHSQDSMGFMVETTPAVGLGENQLKVLSGLFTQGLIPGTSVQILLYASPDILPLLDHWALARHASRPDAQSRIFEFLAGKRVDYLRRGNWRSLFSDQPMLVRDFRLFITVVRPVIRGTACTVVESGWLSRTRDALRGILSSAGLSSRTIDAEAFLNVIDTLLNPTPGRRVPLHWEDDRLLNEQAVDAETLLLVGRDGLTLSRREHLVEVRPYSVRQYPQTWAGWGMSDLIGDLFGNSLRLPCPFLYTLTVHMPDQVSAAHGAKMKAARATQMTESGMGRFLPAWRERKQDWDFVTRLVEDGHKLLKSHIQLLLFPLQGEGDYAEQRLNALFESRGWTLQKDRFTAVPAFLAGLPLMPGPGFVEEMRVLGRLRTSLTWSCINTAPMIGEWKGTGTPLLMLLGRRGQIMHIDPFDNKKGNFNVAVAAASGAGKSFFTQEMVTSLLGTGGRVWVIDSGRSYERLCRLVGGTYLEFSEGTQINLNPFTGLRDIGEETPMLKSVLAQMAAPHQGLNSLQTAFLEEAIKASWIERGDRTTITQVAGWLLAHEDDSARRVGRMLYPYTREGSYGHFFEGEANIDLNNPFVVLELGELDAKPDLQTVVLLLLMMRITETMYLGDRNQRKLCIIDEAWRLMGNGNAGQFIEQGYRTARKFGGAFMTITQGIDDYFKSGTSKAALDNADWVFLLRQKPESIKAAENSDRIMMDDALRKLLTSVDTQQGKYSEIAIMGPGGTTVGRLVVDPFAEKLYSTRAEEYSAIEAMQRQGMSLVEAIEQLVNTAEER
ncbi:MAG: type IV secretion system protein TraC [Gammaproteobacteria bacterium]|nr:type IV secretion system protein TraC [Gammaproteobacteria bacterium]